MLEICLWNYNTISANYKKYNEFIESIYHYKTKYLLQKFNYVCTYIRARVGV